MELSDCWASCGGGLGTNFGITLSSLQLGWPVASVAAVLSVTH